MIQLELPLFDVRSTADNPVPEQDRTHPAQMVIQHCGKAGNHVSHTYLGSGWFGCPGVPGLRDAAADMRLVAAVREREQIAEMELRTYGCKGVFHPPHTIDGAACPGLTAQQCGTEEPHDHHRWWSIPDAFYWCNGVPAYLLGGRVVEDVELP